MNYQEFLISKVVLDKGMGFDPAEIHPTLFPHQRDIVQWAVKGGRRAIFAAFGLGKSLIQLEIMRQLAMREGGRQLIICPLGVRQEFKRDAQLLGMDATFLRRSEDVGGDGLYLTNYESVRDGRLDVNFFNAVSLDEASVLRSYGSKTYQNFLTLFSGVKYRFVATATPSPNRHKELIHYAGFLGIMDTGQALTRFFQRDSTKANNLTIYPHKEREFYLWLNSWAIFLQRPSDLGYSDEGYQLPPVKIHYHRIKTDIAFRPNRDGQYKLFNDASLSLQDASAEKRSSIGKRVLKVREIINAIRERGSAEEISPGVLPEKQRTDDRKPEGEGFSAIGRTEGVQGELLPRKQSSTAGEAEGNKQEKLQGKEDNIQGKVEKLGQREPGKDEDSCQEEQGRKHGEIQGLQEEALLGKHGCVIDECENIETEILRVNSSGLRKDDVPARGRLCDLREGEQVERPILPPCGPLPQDRESQGPPLREMQHCTRLNEGQPVSLKESCGLPQFIVWCDLNDEQRAIDKVLSDEGISSVSLYGSTDINARDDEINLWKQKKRTAFVSKPVMYGAGINMQQCSIAIYLGVSFKFQDFIQSIHRIYRFLQTEQVEIHIIHTDTEDSVLRILKDKWDQHEKTVEIMSEIIKKHGLNVLDMAKEFARSMGCERIEVTGQRYKAVNNDCVEETKLMETNSVGLIHTSIPFSNHYEYSPSFNDFGHNANNDEFFKQMDFLTPELLRVLQPGRVAAIHVKDRVQFGNVTGYGMPSMDPFHVDCIIHYRKHGFIYFGMITVVTDVVRENNQTYRLGWTENSKDGSKMGVGCPEYILLFRKLPSDTSTAYADEPVAKSKDVYTRAQWQVDAHAFWRSSGDRLLASDEIAKYPVDIIGKMFERYTLENIYDYEAHVRIGNHLELKGVLPSTFMLLDPASNHPDVWHDVNRMLTLNGNQKRKNLTQHICPLQHDIVTRIINRYSNEGDVVYDPFGGLMTVPYNAVKMGRSGIGCELNPESFKDGLAYLNAADREFQMPTLFDFEGAKAA